MKKYIVMKVETGGGYWKYDAADIYLKDDEGYTFVCDCGDWNNILSRKTAKKICKMLNEELKKEGK